MKKRAVSLLLILSLILTFVIAASAVTTDVQPTGVDYGLAKTCADGNILQCFNWKLSDIKAELPNIARAGFTSVQTSPLQRHDGNSAWYWLYQPTGFTIGNEIGSLNDLKSLCTEADKYGIKVIVDVVSNHLAGSKSGSWAGSIESDMRNSNYFHNEGACNDYNNRYDLTHKNIGMPDLNTENTYVQNKVVTMVNSLKSAGVDGIRWDAAKHIGLPSEGSSFWSKVSNNGLYNYGEVLEGPAGKSAAAINNPLAVEYTDYIGITDEPFSGTITGAIRDKKVVKTKGNWTTVGISAKKLVYWGESHDTFSNGDGWTKNLTQNQIDRAYAILGARADAQALYLSRPSSTNYSSIYAGNKGSTHFTSNEVAAVNRFHNAMVGKAEAYGTANNCYVVCREGGAVIVSPASQNIDVSVTNLSGLVPEGTYIDEVSGGSFTVTSTKISGRIGSTGIAVIDPMKFTPAPTTAPTTAPTAPPTVKPSDTILIGDADQDDVITILDATRIQRRLAELDVLTAKATAAADADRDGSVTILDATCIQRKIASLDPSSAVGTRVSYP